VSKYVSLSKLTVFTYLRSTSYDPSDMYDSVFIIWLKPPLNIELREQPHTTNR